MGLHITCWRARRCPWNFLKIKYEKIGVTIIFEKTKFKFCLAPRVQVFLKKFQPIWSSRIYLIYIRVSAYMKRIYEFYILYFIYIMMSPYLYWQTISFSCLVFHILSFRQYHDNVYIYSSVHHVPLSIYLSIYLFIYICIYLSIHLFIKSLYLFIYLSI